MIYRLLIALIICSAGSCTAQERWSQRPVNEWPTITMINEVWYENGDRYVHESFEYAGTGFLVDTGTDTVAITAKHVLWIAPNKATDRVDINDELSKWVMRPKGISTDSVVIHQLINTDTTELLSGPGSNIQHTDMIVFTTQHISKNIQPLTARYSPLVVGEEIYILGCPYAEEDCQIYPSKVLAQYGNRVIFARQGEDNIGGISGGPVIDKNGNLIAIVDGLSVDPITGDNALYGLSTAYLKKVLEKDPQLNKPLISLKDPFISAFKIGGINAIATIYDELLTNKPFVYDFQPESINAIVDEILKNGNQKDAIEFLMFSYKVYKSPQTKELIEELKKEE